jgi:hypothetical protein
MRQLDEADRRKQELSSSALEMHSKKAEILVNATLPFMQQVQQATQAKVDPQIIETQILGPAKQVLDRLTQEKLPNGEPVLNKNDMQGVQAALSGPPGSLLKFITGAYQSNMKAQQQIAELQTKALQGENVRSEIQHRKTMEEQGAERLAISKGELALKQRKDGEMRAGGLSDEAVDSLSNQILAGAKPQEALANLGRGAQGATDIRKVQNEVARKMKEAGMSANEILAKRQEVAGAAKEVQQAANIAAKVNYAEQEIMRLAPKVLDLSAKVPRGSFVPLNKLMQMKDTAISDPDLKRFKAFNQTLLNAYDMLGARGGSDVGKREANHQALVTADSAEAYEAAVDAIVQEGTISSEAGAASMTSPLRKSTPAATTPQAGSPPPSSPSSGGGGPTMSAQDKSALAWANAHPSDPRAAAIKQKLGVR